VSYLGYDRGRLLALRRRLGDLADEVAAVRLPDPLATDAVRRYRDAATTLVGWLADVAAIDACGFSSPFQPVALDPADAAFVDVLRPGDAAWSAVTDPRAITAVAADVRARHLGEYLAALDLSQVLGNERRAGEVMELLEAAAADTAGRAALLDTLGPDRFGAIAEDLARRVAARGASSEATAQADRARTLLDTLAAAWGGAQRAGDLAATAWPAELAERIDPYAIALVVRAAGLAADDLALLAAAAWRGWGGEPGAGIDNGADADNQAPAILLAALAAQPVAARRTLEAFDDDDFSLLFGTSIDPAGVLPVLLASADPRVGTPDEVEHSMVAVLGFLSHHQELAAGAMADGLGTYAGPYLEHLLGACDGARYPARRWDLRGDEPTELVGWIARSPVAAASLEAYLDAIVVGRFSQLAAGPAVDGTLLHHLGAVAGAVDAMVADADVLRATQRNAIWQNVVEGASSVAGTVVTGGFTSAGIVLSRLISDTLDTGLTWMFASAPLTSPLDVPAVIAAEGDRIEERRGRREAAYLAAAFGRSAATMPASAAPPPYNPDEPYLVTRNRWLAAASPADRAARQQLWDAAEAFDAGMSGSLSRYPPADAC
jgi:hypothetical protein